MALSAPGTPRNPLSSIKKPGILKLDKSNRNIPRTPKAQFSTPKINYATPKARRIESIPNTPECFNTVTVETPVPKRRSKERYDEDSNLTVAVRIRPMNSRELACVGATDVVQVCDKDLIIRTQMCGTATMSTDHTFRYDHIFWSTNESNQEYTSQEDVFKALGEPLLDSAFQGYNACLFAYGQTGSGKSFSMMGKNVGNNVDIDSDQFSGMTPRFCRKLFERISLLDEDCIATVEVSFFEIYNEKIHDLLADTATSNRTPLKVREHPELGPYIVNLSVQPVKSYKELRSWLLIGNRNRATAATSMNEKSSRSHSIFSIELCLSEDLKEDAMSRKSRVSLVDLAGSERLGNSFNTEEKIREGVCINKSLLTLGKVISALADQKKNQFVPYRESVLTWLLRESLGGNSLTSMLATITPASTHMDETLATLRYACQARSIVNRARVNENPHDRLIRELRTEVERLRALKQVFQGSNVSASSSSSSLMMDESQNEELEALRMKLLNTETELYEAQKTWQEKFLEAKRAQQKHLADAERCKDELESRIRIMNAVDNNVYVEPYKSNFLEQLEEVLNDRSSGLCDSVQVQLDLIKNWCCDNGLICTFTSDSMIIKDPVEQKQSFVLFSKADMLGFENISDFVNNLTWTEIRKPWKKLTTKEVMMSMNQVYEALADLQPRDSDNELNLLYAKVNKTLQSFEAALLSSVKGNSQKSVTFDM